MSWTFRKETSSRNVAPALLMNRSGCYSSGSCFFPPAVRFFFSGVCCLDCGRLYWAAFADEKHVTRAGQGASSAAISASLV